MAGASILKVAEGITKQLEKMVANANLMPSYLDRVVYRQYQKAQKKRWETENTDPFSAPRQWDALDPLYAVYKRKKFSDFVGHGEKMLIATGTLKDGVIGPKDGVIGPGSKHGKKVEERSITITTTVPYAKWVDEDRTFTTFSPRFYSEVYGGLKEYLAKSIVREVPL